MGTEEKSGINCEIDEARISNLPALCRNKIFVYELNFALSNLGGTYDLYHRSKKFTALYSALSMGTEFLSGLQAMLRLKDLGIIEWEVDLMGRLALRTSGKVNSASHHP